MQKIEGSSIFLGNKIFNFVSLLNVFRIKIKRIPWKLLDNQTGLLCLLRHNAGCLYGGGGVSHSPPYRQKTDKRKNGVGEGDLDIPTNLRTSRIVSQKSGTFSYL